MTADWEQKLLEIEKGSYQNTEALHRCPKQGDEAYPWGDQKQRTESQKT